MIVHALKGIKRYTDMLPTAFLPAGSSTRSQTSLLSRDFTSVSIQPVSILCYWDRQQLPRLMWVHFVTLANGSAPFHNNLVGAFLGLIFGAVAQVQFHQELDSQLELQIHSRWRNSVSKLMVIQIIICNNFTILLVFMNPTSWLCNTFELGQTTCTPLFLSHIKQNAFSRL